MKFSSLWRRAAPNDQSRHHQEQGSAALPSFASNTSPGGKLFSLASRFLMIFVTPSYAANWVALAKCLASGTQDTALENEGQQKHGRKTRFCCFIFFAHLISTNAETSHSLGNTNRSPLNISQPKSF